MHGKNLALIKQIPSKRFFSPRQAKHYLGISVRLLNELTATGALPAYNNRGRREYRLEDLDKLGESHERWIPGQCQGPKRLATNDRK